MDVPYISKSRLGLFLNCPLAYKYKYDEGVLGMLNKYAETATLGKRIHKVMELHFNNDSEYQETDVRDIYNMINDPELVLTSKAFYGGLEILDRWIESHKDSKYCTVLETEKEYNLFINGIPVKVVIDMIQSDDDTIYIRDFKTGKNMISQEELDTSDLQAGIYQLVGRELYPDKKIIFCLEYLRYGITMLTQWNPERLDNLEDYLKMMYETIKNLTNVKPRISNYCNLCEYKQHCKTHNEENKKIKYENEYIDIETKQNID